MFSTNLLWFLIFSAFTIVVVYSNTYENCQVETTTGTVFGYKLDGYCYYVNTAGKSYINARDECKLNEYSDMASVNSEAIHALIKDLMISKLVGEAWVGAHSFYRSEKEEFDDGKNIMWINGESISKETETKYWGDLSTYGKDDKCGVLTSDGFFVMLNYYFDETTLLENEKPFICEYKIDGQEDSEVAKWRYVALFVSEEVGKISSCDFSVNSCPDYYKKCTNDQGNEYLHTDIRACTSTNYDCDTQCVFDPIIQGAACAMSEDYFCCYDVLSTNPAVCSGNGYCDGPSQCICDPLITEQLDSDCSIGEQVYTCYGYESNDQNVCNSHGECIADETCECDVSVVNQVYYHGDNCSLYYDSLGSAANLLYTLFTEYLIESLSAIIITTLGLIISILLITMILLVICFRLNKKKKLKKILPTMEFSLSDVPDKVVNDSKIDKNYTPLLEEDRETPKETDNSEENAKLTLELNKSSAKLYQAVTINDAKEIERIANDLIDQLSSNFFTNLANPAIPLLNLSKSVCDDSFPYLDLDAQLKTVSIFVRFLEFALVYYKSSDSKTDLTRKKQKIFENLKLVNQALKKSVDIDDVKRNCHSNNLVTYYSFICEVENLKEGLKLLKPEKSVQLVLETLSKQKNIPALFSRLVNQCNQIPKDWYPRFISIRFLGYKAIKDGEKQSVDQFLSLLPEKSVLSSLDFHFFVSIMFSLFDILKYFANDTIKDQSITNLKSIQSQIFQNLENFGSPPSKFGKKVGLDIKLLFLKQLQMGIKEKYLSEISTEINKFLLKKTVIETDQLVVEFCNRLINVENFAIFVEQEKEMIKKEVDNVFNELVDFESTYNQRLKELGEKEKELQNLEYELDDRMKMIGNGEGNDAKDEDGRINELKYNKEKANDEITSVKKQLNYLRDRELSEKEEEERKELNMKKYKIEEKLLEIDSQIFKIEGSQKIIENVKIGISQLKKEVKILSVQVEEDGEELKRRKEEFNKQIKNVQQIRDDFAVAIQLRNEMITEKNNRLNNFGNVEHVIVDETEEPNAPSIFNLEEEEYDEEAPAEYVCPITLSVMKVPVIVVGSGISYEKETISKWLKDHDTDPITGTKLENKTFIINYAIKKLIEDWKEKHVIKK